MLFLKHTSSCLTLCVFPSFGSTFRSHLACVEYWTSDLVCDLHKEAETFSGLEKQPVGDVLAKLLGFGAGVHLEGLQVPDKTVLAGDLWHTRCWLSVSYLVGIVGEIDLMEDLGGFMLDGLDLHQMRRVLPRPIAVTMGISWHHEEWFHDEDFSQLPCQPQQHFFHILVPRNREHLKADRTVEPCAASACSLQRADAVSLTEGNVGCVATKCCWEETDQYTTRAAPILSPRCTWNYTGPSLVIAAQRTSRTVAAQCGPVVCCLYQ